MLSLDNALDEDELRAFDRACADLLGGAEFRYVAELKMDGLSMAARYRDGVFAQAITRGDGDVGEDVTENARTIRSLPLRVEDRAAAFEVRGEIVMNRRAFERLNADARSAGCRVSPIRAMRRPVRCACWSRGHGVAAARLLHVLPATVDGAAGLRQPLGIARMARRAWASR